jgi:hypothetical protein
VTLATHLSSQEAGDIGRSLDSGWMSSRAIPLKQNRPMSDIAPEMKEAGN